MGKVKDGRMIEVENHQPHHRACKTYIAIHVTDDEGKNEECLLFTKSELRRCRERTANNMEDVPKKSWLTDFIDGD